MKTLPSKIKGVLEWNRSAEDEYRTLSPFPGFTLTVFRDRWYRPKSGKWLYALNGARQHASFDHPEQAIRACEIHANTHLLQAIEKFGGYTAMTSRGKRIRDR